MFGKMLGLCWKVCGEALKICVQERSMVNNRIGNRYNNVSKTINSLALLGELRIFLFSHSYL